MLSQAGTAVSCHFPGLQCRVKSCPWQLPSIGGSQVADCLLPLPGRNRASPSGEGDGSGRRLQRSIDLDPEPRPHYPASTLASHTVPTRPRVGGNEGHMVLKTPQGFPLGTQKVYYISCVHLLLPHILHQSPHTPRGSCWEAPVWPGHFRTWCSADSMEDSGW